MSTITRTQVPGGWLFRGPGFAIVSRHTGGEIYLKSGPAFDAMNRNPLRFEPMFRAIREAGMQHHMIDIVRAIDEERRHPKPIRLDVHPDGVRYVWTSRKARWAQIVRSLKALASNRPSEAVVGDR